LDGPIAAREVERKQLAKLNCKQLSEALARAIEAY
jgi:hypothetical protein